MEVLTQAEQAKFLLQDQNPEDASLQLEGSLTAASAGPLWRDLKQRIARSKFSRLKVDCAGLTYCDGSGIALLMDLILLKWSRQAEVTIINLQPRFQELLGQFDPQDFVHSKAAKPRSVSSIVQVGRGVHILWQDTFNLVSFIGHVFVAGFQLFKRGHRIRWRDVLLVADNAGANALPIVALISFLIGLIMAFQSAMPMKQFGAEIFVANLVALSMLRELGPLMTAIILAGRSGSAFAAEIGTMKVNEEVASLTTMGVDPVRFLVITRLMGAVVITPLLTVFSNLMGLIGGWVVLISMGYPTITYVQQVLGAVGLKDLSTGLFKSVVFGILVAAVGCFRGLQTEIGASAVGISTTKAVVSGLILIVMADGLFSVLFYYLNI